MLGSIDDTMNKRLWLAVLLVGSVVFHQNNNKNSFVFFSTWSVTSLIATREHTNNQYGVDDVRNCCRLIPPCGSATGTTGTTTNCMLKGIR